MKPTEEQLEACKDFLYTHAWTPSPHELAVWLADREDAAKRRALAWRLMHPR